MEDLVIEKQTKIAQAKLCSLLYDCVGIEKQKKFCTSKAVLNIV